jgi:hypothetical protein
VILQTLKRAYCLGEINLRRIFHDKNSNIWKDQF